MAVTFRPTPVPVGQKTPEQQFRGMAITGVPGAGKTTLALALIRELDYNLITSHDLVMRVDPKAIEEGRMANSQQMAEAFVSAMADHRGHRIIIDGWPRTFAQAGLLPEDIAVFMLECRPDIAVARQLARGRAFDDEEIVRKRTAEQAQLMESGTSDSWSHRLATWQRTLNVTNLSAAIVARNVLAYWRGQKMEIN